jgi:hypothetical protein
VFGTFPRTTEIQAEDEIVRALEEGSTAIDVLDAYDLCRACDVTKQQISHVLRAGPWSEKPLGDVTLALMTLDLMINYKGKDESHFPNTPKGMAVKINTLLKSFTPVPKPVVDIDLQDRREKGASPPPKQICAEHPLFRALIERLGPDETESEYELLSTVLPYIVDHDSVSRGTNRPYVGRGHIDR